MDLRVPARQVSAKKAQLAAAKERWTMQSHVFSFFCTLYCTSKKTILSLSHDPVLLEEPAIFKQSAFEFFFPDTAIYSNALQTWTH